LKLFKSFLVYISFWILSSDYGILSCGTHNDNWLVKGISNHVCSRRWENPESLYIVTHVKVKTNKGNHAQHLKHKNKVQIKCFGSQDTYFSGNKENIRAYKEKLHEVR
jgi:hypothetical protein